MAVHKIIYFIKFEGCFKYILFKTEEGLSPKYVKEIKYIKQIAACLSLIIDLW